MLDPRFENFQLCQQLWHLLLQRIERQSVLVQVRLRMGGQLIQDQLAMPVKQQVGLLIISLTLVDLGLWR